ncbi:XRE family transcriptional regulator [Dehalogenimonas sp. THU2]|uniref:helix-turn-helix domain-containing protein n=1 Tax=Dehalogenimonas sp. THU2 TaxID=3151121 RepID=UPI0032184F3E
MVVITVRINKAAMLRAIARRNMTQNMFAAQVGVCSGYLSQIICGARNPSPQMRGKIQDALAPLTFDDIFILEESDDGD